jgi:hypothetical protein
LEAFRTAPEEVIRDKRAKQHHLLGNDHERLPCSCPRDFTRSASASPDKPPVHRKRNRPYSAPVNGQGIRGAAGAVTRR